MRTIHLCTGLFSLAFLLMYAVSAVQMAHRTWFPLRPVVSEQRIILAAGLSDGRVVARQLIQRGLRGDLRSVDPGPTELRLRIVRPGTVYDAAYTIATGSATVKTSTSNWLGMLNRLHHSEGLWHDQWLLNAWTVIAALISTGLFVTGATGIYLWFQNHRERVLGVVLLTAGLSVTMPLILWMRW